MRFRLLASAVLLALPLVAAGSAQAAPIFPNIGSSTNGPALIITLTDSGPRLQMLSSQTYNGNDVEVGLINSSSTTQTSLSLSGSGNGGGIFAFDGDGIVNYINANTGQLTVGNPADTSGYAGPGVTFSNISADETSGTIIFNLAPDEYAYFALEGSPDSINQGGGITIGGGSGTAVPEPASAALLLASLSCAALDARARRRHRG